MGTKPRHLLFGNDGWHGRIGEEFSLDNVVRMAEGLAVCLSDIWPDGTVYLGFDTRFGMREMAQEVAGILSAYGLIVKLSDVAVPTACVAWTAAQDRDAVAAVILTSSERPYNYGGLLVRTGDGGTCPRTFLDEVERQVPNVATKERGSFELVNMADAYIDSMLDFVDHEGISRAEFTIVVDALYGAAQSVAARLFEAAGCEVIRLHTGMPALDEQLKPLPREPWAAEAQACVRESGADLGFVFDGDADRVRVLDAEGKALDPRQLTPLVLQDLVVEHDMSGRVVSTLACSNQIARTAERLELEHTSVPVGFGRIAQEIEEHDVLLATEEYGGIAIPAHLPERDGIFVALLILELLAAQASSNQLRPMCENLESRIGRTVYGRRDLAMEAGAIEALRMILPGINPEMIGNKKPVSCSHADGLRMTFEDGSWIMLRPSRMDPVVRIYAESEDERVQDQLLDDTCEMLKNGAIS